MFFPTALLGAGAGMVGGFRLYAGKCGVLFVGFLFFIHDQDAESGFTLVGCKKSIKETVLMAWRRLWC